MSTYPDQRSVSRQHPGSGRSTIEGPAPPGMMRVTRGPTFRRPTIRWARMRRSEPGLCCTRETQRILFDRCAEGGDTSGKPNTIATMRPERPSSCGIGCVGGSKPLRAHVGSTPAWTRSAQGSELLVLELVLVRQRLDLLLLDEAALGGLLEQALGRREVVQMNRVAQLNPFRLKMGPGCTDSGRPGLLGAGLRGGYRERPYSRSDL